MWLFRSRGLLGLEGSGRFRKKCCEQPQNLTYESVGMCPLNTLLNMAYGLWPTSLVLVLGPFVRVVLGPIRLLRLSLHSQEIPFQDLRVASLPVHFAMSAFHPATSGDLFLGPEYLQDIDIGLLTSVVQRWKAASPVTVCLAFSLLKKTYFCYRAAFEYGFGVALLWRMCLT